MCLDAPWDVYRWFAKDYPRDRPCGLKDEVETPDVPALPLKSPVARITEWHR